MLVKKSHLYLGVTALVLCALGWGLWRWYEHRYPTWQEEVQLSDGRVIVVKQEREHYDNYGTAQSWLTFSLPEMGGKRTWHSHLTPQRIDVHEGKVYVFGFPRGDKQFAFYHRPKNYMVAAVWADGDFKRIPFISVPEMLRQEENVYPCISVRRDQLLTIATKREKWCSARGDRGQFGKKVNLDEYKDLAAFYADLTNSQPASE